MSSDILLQTILLGQLVSLIVSDGVRWEGGENVRAHTEHAICLL